MRSAIMTLWLLALAAPAFAGLLAGQGAFVLDQTGAQRATFSNNERIVLQQKVFNSVASANRLSFRFFILGPSGAQVFQHVGNAVVGSVGNAASQVSGVPVSQFFSGPGFYTFRAEAELDGQVLVQQAQFSVSSPNILLIYPPSGARNMADNPLTFRWSASGASRYRVTVGDNPSLYNSIFNQATGGSESFLTYPQNPTDPRQRLTAGQVYYWIVEGLDPSGNVIATSRTPFDYSVSATSLARDLAVTDLTIDAPIGQDGSVKLKVRVANQGNTTEASVNLRIGVGGLPAQGTPIAVTGLTPGAAREWTVDGMIPVDQKQTLATACLELFDDNVPNNCKTLSVTRPVAGTGAPTSGGGTPLLSQQQMLDMLTELLKGSGVDMTGYVLDSSLDPKTLASLIDGLRQGTVQATVTGTPGTPTPAGGINPALVGSTVSSETRKVMPDFGSAPEVPEAGPEEPVRLSLEQAWSGLSEQLKRVGVDLGGYVPSGKVDPSLLGEFLDGVRKGTVKAEVTGAPAPAPAGAGAPISLDAAGPEPKQKALDKLLSGAPAAPEAKADDEDDGGGSEWTGMAGPAGKQPFTFVVKDQDDWVKRWKRLRDGKVPVIDFKKNIVVGVVAGAADAAVRAEIESVGMGDSGLVVRYKLVSRAALAADKLRTRVPWILRQVRASPGLDVHFERAVEGGGER